MFLPQKNDTQAFLPECHQILFLYSYFKSVLEHESYIVLGFHNHFLYKTAPNPGIELAGYAVLLFQSANESFKQFSLCLLAFNLLCDIIIPSLCLFIPCCKFGIVFFILILI